MGDEKTYWVQVRIDAEARERVWALADLLDALGKVEDMTPEKTAKAIDATCAYAVWCEEG